MYVDILTVCRRLVITTVWVEVYNPEFLNRRSAARYRALASIIPGPREVLLEVVILVF